MALEGSSNQIEPKCVILGHTGVGKTSMVNQYCRGTFGETTATIGAAFMKKTVEMEGWSIVLQIWDTAGQERFRSMAPMYYRGAHAAVLVYDVTDRSTFEKVRGWVDELQANATADIVMVLAANKCDKELEPNSSSVDVEEAKAFAKEHNILGPFETSALSGKGIEDLFGLVAKKLLDAERKRQKDQEAESQRRALRLNGSGSSSKSGCCS